MSPNEFTMIFGGKDGRLTIEDLKKTLESALNMLRGIQSGLLAADIDVQWEIVRIRKQSPLRMTFSPIVTRRGRRNPSAGRKLVKSLTSGLQDIETGSNVPRCFSDDAFDATKQLLRPWTNRGASVTIETQGNSKIRLTENAVQHLDEIAAKAKLYVDYSTIEGRLEVISVHERSSFFIWETLTNHKIECFVTDEQIADMSAILLQHPRISVTGRVSYRNHIPKTIHVEEKIRILRSSKDLPQIDDIAPIDITGGVATEDYIQRMRNA